MPDLREALTGAAAGRLQEGVRAALGQPRTVPGGRHVAPRHGGACALMTERWGRTRAGREGARR